MKEIEKKGYRRIHIVFGILFFLVFIFGFIWYVPVSIKAQLVAYLGYAVRQVLMVVVLFIIGFLVYAKLKNK